MLQFDSSSTALRWLQKIASDPANQRMLQACLTSIFRGTELASDHDERLSRLATHLVRRSVIAIRRTPPLRPTGMGPAPRVRERPVARTVRRAVAVAREVQRPAPVGSDRFADALKAASEQGSVFCESCPRCGNEASAEDEALADSLIQSSENGDPYTDGNPCIDDDRCSSDEDTQFEFRVQIRSSDFEVRGGVSFDASWDGGGICDTTDSDGWVVVSGAGPMPSAMQLTVERRQFQLWIGGLPDVQDVTGVQARLNNLGYSCGGIDGKWGKNSRRAANAFCEAYGLSPCHDPDDDLRAALMQYGEHSEAGELTSEPSASPQYWVSGIDGVLVVPEASTLAMPPWMEIAIEEARKAGGVDEEIEPLKSMAESYLVHARYGKATSKTAWCAAFVSWCLDSSGYTSPKTTASRVYIADDPANNQKSKDLLVKCDEPFVGAIAVFSNVEDGKVVSSGHVNFVYGLLSNGKVACLGGNQGDRLRVSGYDCSGNAVFSHWKDKTDEKGKPIRDPKTKKKVKVKVQKKFRGYFRPIGYIPSAAELKLRTFSSDVSINQELLNVELAESSNGESTR